MELLWCLELGSWSFHSVLSASIGLTVLVTFLETGTADPSAPSLSPEQVANLRGKLAAWEEDWNAPGMEAYDQP